MITVKSTLLKSARSLVLSAIYCAGACFATMIAHFAMAPALAAGARRIIPIFARTLTNGDRRFFVNVSVNGVRLPAMFDTGSSGLRILTAAVSSAGLQTGGPVRHYGYGSGVMLNGKIAPAQLVIGGTAVPASIGVQDVVSVTCGPRKPACPAARISATDYRIGGDGLARQGFSAILGTSMIGPSGRGAAENPLSFLGSRWIVELPKKNQGEGRLIVNPDAGDLKGFNRLRWLGSSTEIPDCPSEPIARQISCPAMGLDSGARPSVPPFYRYAILFDRTRRQIWAKAR